MIPTRRDQRRNPRFDAEAYRGCNVVESCILQLKENRRLAMVKLAMIR